MRHLTIQLEWVWTDDKGNMLTGQIHRLAEKWISSTGQGSIEIYLDGKKIHTLPISPPRMPVVDHGLEG